HRGETVRIHAIYPRIPKRFGSDFVSGITKNKPANQIRMLVRQALSDHASYRKPNHNRGGNVERPEKRSKIFDMILHPLRCWWRIRKSVPALVIKDDPIVPREFCGHLLPNAEISPQRIGEDNYRCVSHSPNLVMQDESI